MMSAPKLREEIPAPPPSAFLAGASQKALENAPRSPWYFENTKPVLLALGRPKPWRYATVGHRSAFWRRRRDSNPWTACTVGGFQNRCLRPLGHSSRSLFSSVSPASWIHDRPRLSPYRRFHGDAESSRHLSAAPHGLPPRLREVTADLALRLRKALASASCAVGMDRGCASTTLDATAGRAVLRHGEVPCAATSSSTFGPDALASALCERCDPRRGREPCRNGEGFAWVSWPRAA